MTGPKQYFAAMAPWSRQMFEPGQPWENFPKETKKVRPHVWLNREVVQPLSQGKWVWAHNARFDLRFLARNLESADYQTAARSLGGYLSPHGRQHGRLHVTAGRQVYEATRLARQDTTRAPEHFIESYGHWRQTLSKAAQDPRQGLFLDTQ